MEMEGCTITVLLAHWGPSTAEFFSLKPRSGATRTGQCNIWAYLKSNLCERGNLCKDLMAGGKLMVCSGLRAIRVSRGDECHGLGHRIGFQDGLLHGPPSCLRWDRSTAIKDRETIGKGIEQSTKSIFFPWPRTTSAFLAIFLSYPAIPSLDSLLFFPICIKLNTLVIAIL